jgi:hypothetical protein
LCVQILPDGASAERQLDIIHSLATYKFDKFGDYDRTFIEWYGKPFVDVMEEHPDVVTAYNQLKSNLTKAEDTITQRNANRPYPYRYLQPSEMINSISI